MSKSGAASKTGADVTGADVTGADVTGADVTSLGTELGFFESEGAGVSEGEGVGTSPLTKAKEEESRRTTWAANFIVVVRSEIKLYRFHCIRETVDCEGL